jgi:ATP-dependent Clp protease ATP-binding subunit ClpA
MSDDAKDWLAREGYDPLYGARPLRRAVQRYVENPLSNRILAGEFKEGDLVQVEATPEGLTYGLVNAPIEALV